MGNSRKRKPRVRANILSVWSACLLVVAVAATAVGVSLATKIPFIVTFAVLLKALHVIIKKLSYLP